MCPSCTKASHWTSTTCQGHPDEEDIEMPLGHLLGLLSMWEKPLTKPMQVLAKPVSYSLRIRVQTGKRETGKRGEGGGGGMGIITPMSTSE